MSKELTLKDCPFCGSDTLLVDEKPLVVLGARTYHSIRCDFCGMETIHLNKGRLIARWNIRTADKMLINAATDFRDAVPLVAWPVTNAGVVITKEQFEEMSEKADRLNEVLAALDKGE